MTCAPPPIVGSGAHVFIAIAEVHPLGCSDGEHLCPGVLANARTPAVTERRHLRRLAIQKGAA